MVDWIIHHGDGASASSLSFHCFIFLVKFMKNISYCTTCKGRLWQLKQTLPVNIKQTGDGVDIILLDYHSEDGLEDYIKAEYSEYLNDGRLKYYKIRTTLEGFDMAYAKHITHMLAGGDLLFNLDADNYIGSTVDEMRTLPRDKILIPRIVNGTATARCGRVGISRLNYMRIGGYDIKMLGMQNDDGDLVHRAWVGGLRFVFSSDDTIPIEQSIEEKMKFIRTEQDYTCATQVSVENWKGEVNELDLTHNVNVINRRKR